MRNDEALHDTTNDAKSTMGKAKSLMGIQRSLKHAAKKCGKKNLVFVTQMLEE